MLDSHPGEVRQNGEVNLVAPFDKNNILASIIAAKPEALVDTGAST